MRVIYRLLLWSLIALGWVASTSKLALAYEVETHEDMSEQAVLQSKLKEYLLNIGLKTTNDQLTDVNTTKTIPEWIIFGSNEEDDTLSANFARYRNHFYDPQHNGQGYSFGLLTGEPSPDWGLEDIKTFISQSYSFKDARQYFYDALTLPDKDNREMWMARTFYTLGHIIHLIQDAAQPQHTRNDSHGGGIFGPVSRYEKYTDLERVRQNLPFSDAHYNPNNPVIFDKARSFWDTGDGRGIAEFSSFNFVSAGTNFDADRYEFPKLSEAVPHDEPANALLESIGMTPPAGCLPPHPPCMMTFYSTEVRDNYRPEAGATNPRTSTESIFDQDLKARNLKPAFSLNRFNFDAAHQFLIPRAVAYSAGLINYFFRGRLEAVDPAFTNQGIALKVKNAIDAKKEPQLANEILYQDNGGEASHLVLAYAYKLNGEDKAGASEPIPLKQYLAPGQVSSDTYVFNTSSLPADATDIKYRLVFKGKLGQEIGAVAAGNATPASGFGFVPNYLPADGVAGTRNIYQSETGWRLNRTGEQLAANIDWKGWYEGGKPTKVLSWYGPQARYFAPSGSQSNFTPIIYQAGEAFAVAPAPVLGAALMKDNEGQEWLIVICQQGMTDVVYRRPNKKSDSSALHDANTNPEGWKKMQEFSAQDGHQLADVPWFFNGNGTEAQTMRKALREIKGTRSQVVYKNVPYPEEEIEFISIAPLQGTHLDRLKIRITGDAATLENIGNSLIKHDSTVVFDRTLECVKNCELSAVKPLCAGSAGGMLGSADPSLGTLEALAMTPKHETELIQTSEYKTIDQGSYVVAVDYKDQQEVLAEYQVDAQQTDFLNRYQDELKYICVFNGQNEVSLLAPAQKESWQKHNYKSLVNNRLRVGNIEHTIEKHEFDIMRVRTEFVAASPPKWNNDYHTPKVLLRRIRYADLRHNVLLYSEEDRVYRAEQLPPESPNSPKVEYDSTKQVVLESSGSKTTVDQKIEKNVGTNWPVHLDMVPPVSEQSLSNMTTDAFVSSFGFPIVPIREGISLGLFFGSWEAPAQLVPEAFMGALATDANENVFASFEYVDKNGQKKYFNFLTNGDIKALVPLAPEDAHYYPIAVIK